MKRKKLGILISSSVITASTIIGTTLAIELADKKTYSPTQIEMQRLSLLDTFLNDDHFKENNLKNKDVGNPFALYSKAKISQMVEKLLVKQDEFKRKLGYVDDKYNDPKNFPINLVNKISFLSLEKTKYSIIVELNDVNGKPFEEEFLKLNVKIDYSENMLKKWIMELSPESVEKSKDNEKLSELDFSVLEKVKDHLVSKTRDNYLGAMKPLKTDELNSDSEFSKKLIQSLILWQVYNADIKNNSFKNMGDLKAYLSSEKQKDLNLYSEINKKLEPFEYAMKYFPSKLDIDSEVELVNSNFKTTHKINIDRQNKASNIFLFEDFKISTMMGLILFPDSWLDLSDKNNAVLNPVSNEHRIYNALSILKDWGEYEVEPPFEDSLNHYGILINKK